ncbi:MAG: TrmJ/YjtD family RNA methyltransferase [Caldithrix sp.]|nr:TrmJ/YjtD family RNA methyltransferase [Caldithrix sp.]
MTKRIPITNRFKQISANLHFILVEPESPGNIGAVARALKTTGFKHLVLIKPCDLETEELKRMAHRSMDIVNNAVIYEDYKTAFSSYRLLVATSMRKRHFRFPIHSPDEISEKLIPVAMDHPVAIVFGRERTGLTNEEILQCHLHSTITTATQNPALNLAQSVMLYSHNLFMNANTIDTNYKYKLATQNELEILYEHVVEAMNLVQFKPRDGMDNFITRFRRLIGRANAEHRDVRLLHKLLQIFETRIRYLESQVQEEEQNNIY